MNFLAENPLPIWVTAALLLTMAAVVYFQTGRSGALAAMALIVAIAAALLAAEHFIETPREAVERTLYEMADVVEANDVDGAIGCRRLGPCAVR